MVSYLRDILVPLILSKGLERWYTDMSKYQSNIPNKTTRIAASRVESTGSIGTNFNESNYQIDLDFGS